MMGRGSAAAAPSVGGQAARSSRREGGWEHVAGVGLPSGGALEQQGQGTVGHRVLAQIVVDDQHVLPLAHEILAHGRTGVGGDVTAGAGSSPAEAETMMVYSMAPAYSARSAPGGHGGRLLADGHIDADDVLPFWLRMVSTAMAVLPVWRSPMISSRWPRPMGIMASMAKMPVCRGTLTAWRLDHAGAGLVAWGGSRWSRWGLGRRWLAKAAI